MIKKTIMNDTQTQTMTNEDAKIFEYQSDAAALFLLNVLECDCQPYVDVFTYNRWKAQDFQVQRGEKGIGMTTYKVIETGKENEDGTAVTRSIPKRYSVFCRCQVKENGAK